MKYLFLLIFQSCATLWQAGFYTPIDNSRNYYGPTTIDNGASSPYGNIHGADATINRIGQDNMDAINRFGR